MASAMKKKKEEEEAFREEQRRKAASQGATSPNAVPEQRPQAFAETRPDEESEVFKRRKEAGDFDPMPPEAFEKAASSAQAKKAEKQSKKLGVETLREGQRVIITDGVYKGAEGAITEVHWANESEAQKARSGDPAVARFAKASSYMVRTRGSGHALVEVKPDEVESINRLAGVNTRGA